MQVTTAQGTMMSGPALWTTDIGGYHGGNTDDPEFQELIVVSCSRPCSYTLTALSGQDPLLSD